MSRADHNWRGEGGGKAGYISVMRAKPSQTGTTQHGRQDFHPWHDDYDRYLNQAKYKKGYAPKRKDEPWSKK